MSRRKHDVFISHASEDKEDFVRPLAEELRRRGIDVWFDEFSLKIGDSLSEAIDRGLANSRLGIVVISPRFISKRWPRRELSGLVARQMATHRNVILPVWHGVRHATVLRFSPPLADLLAATSSDGIAAVADQIETQVLASRRTRRRSVSASNNLGILQIPAIYERMVKAMGDAPFKVADASNVLSSDPSLDDLHRYNFTFGRTLHMLGVLENRGILEPDHEIGHENDNRKKRYRVASWAREALITTKTR